MIDTMGFFIIISYETYNWLRERSIMTQRVYKESGFVEFEYNNFHTSHGNESWRYQVMWKMDTKSWVYDLIHKIPVYIEGVPYLRFEFSAPKILFGHNLYSCNESDALVACNYVRDAFMHEFDVTIPRITDWYCYRLDTCANFELENEQQVRSYIRYLQRFDYPRRIKNLYEDTGIYFASRYSTLKIYCKGLEFKKHDMSRFIYEVDQQRLYKQAQKILRVEVEHKAKLKTIPKELASKGYLYPTFNGYMKIVDLFNGNFDAKKETERIIEKFMSGSETKVMKSLDVFRLLNQFFGRRQANTYYAIYLMLVTQGQKETKRNFSKALYYKALKAFRLLGISFIASDIQKFDIELARGFPKDFSLCMSESNKYYQFPRAA
ncbi:hypothetical protein A45J_2423 [hot springs metagenome]|uniref:Replication-associated protein G2P N-terminal domain-containing protein n=1 Tax=hot springs metagenome TaxID=433727 RepID=A0A5J4L9B5_9ZZZZ